MTVGKQRAGALTRKWSWRALAGASARTTASAVEPVKEELCLCGDDWVARSSFPIRS
jgi:hypothetical protein